MQADGLLDFTAPAATVDFAGLAAQARIAHVVGTTGLSEADLARLAAAGPPRPDRALRQHEPWRQSPGRAGAPRRRVARSRLGHRDRRDASPHEGGCALRHRAAARRGRGGRPRRSSLRTTRPARATAITGARAPGSIGFSALRGGTVVGDHRVIFAGAGRADRTVPRGRGPQRVRPRAPSRPPCGRAAASPASTAWPTCSASAKPDLNDGKSDGAPARPRPPRPERLEPEEPVHRLEGPRPVAQGRRGGPAGRPRAEGPSAASTSPSPRP